MCLTVTCRKSKVAKKPIICYKLMFPYGNENEGEGQCVIHMDIHPNMKPVYFNSTVCRMKYELGAEYTEGKFTEALPGTWSGGSYDIQYGFHSYSRLKDAEYMRNRRAYVVVVKCEIPAGARYWKGNRERWPRDGNYFEYCSDKIRVLAWKHPYTGKWSNTK